jgi:hypothetical protein
MKAGVPPEGAAARRPRPVFSVLSVVCILYIIALFLMDCKPRQREVKSKREEAPRQREVKSKRE